MLVANRDKFIAAFTLRVAEPLPKLTDDADQSKRNVISFVRRLAHYNGNFLDSRRKSAHRFLASCVLINTRELSYFNSKRFNAMWVTHAAFYNPLLGARYQHVWESFLTGVNDSCFALKKQV